MSSRHGSRWAARDCPVLRSRRSKVAQPFEFTLDNGSPLKMAPGQTFVELPDTHQDSHRSIGSVAGRNLLIRDVFTASAVSLSSV
jgi:hypothetical protein